MEENMGDTWFYVKVNKLELENSSLREEVVKLDDKNVSLERINTRLKRQLEEELKRYDELQREYDKLKEVFDEVIETEKMNKVALKKCMSERKILITKLEAAELEAQKIASLKEKLKKVTNERSESTKKVVAMIKTLDEEHAKCELLQEILTELEETNGHLQEICDSRENTIQLLRDTNRKLTDENAELKLLIDTNVHLSIDQNSTPPNSDTESYYMYGTTSSESNGGICHDSLYDELKASGFTNSHDRDGTINRQFENQVRWYELEIDALLRQTERAFEQLVSIYGEEPFSLCATQNLDYTDCNEKTQMFETFKRRIQILLDMFTGTPSKIADIGTQLRADSRAIENLPKVSNFHDRLENALSASNGSTCALTINQNSHEETAYVQSDILHKDENFPLQMGSDIVQGSSQRLTMGIKDSKRTNEATSERDLTQCGNISKKHSNTTQRALEFTNVNVESHGGMIQRYRRSISESSLITEKKPSPFFHHSFNDFTMLLSPEKTSEVVETREKTISDLISKERKRKNVDETMEQNGVQNLMSWHEYKFGGTYRTLSDSTDSSICSTPSRHDNSLLRFRPLSQRFSDFDIYESSAVYSTPIRTDSEDKNFCMYKKDMRQTSSKSRRRSSCGSLIRQFVDLDISNENNNLLSVHSECHLNKVNEHVESVNSKDTQNIPPLLNKSPSYRPNMLKRSSHVFIKHENAKEYGISDEIQFSVTTVEETKDFTDSSQERIYEASPVYENNTNGFEKSVHIDLLNIEELQDILEKIENSLEENNNSLRGNEWHTPSSVKSNDLLSGICQNFKSKLTDSSKLEIVGSEKSTPVVSRAPKNSILTIPSWRMFFSCALVLVLGYYFKDVISLRSTSSGAPCIWYSFEEIFNRYFPIGSKKLPPPL